MSHNSFLAFDIGAESGRALLGTLEKNEIQVQEVYRFNNRMISKGGHVYWDVHYLFQEIKKGISKGANASKSSVLFHFLLPTGTRAIRKP
ncbi:MAG: hypothetical protein JRJ77_18570 [Deltaproteobacteria bacterium]|nr:hypothetical protein [Deltaproteobacteria bacterium]